MNLTIKQHRHIIYQAIALSFGIQSLFAQNIVNTKAGEFVQQIGTSDVTFEMVKIPGSVYQMGTSNGSYNDAPLHAVQIDSLWVGKYEVTWELFELFLSQKKVLPDSFPQEKLKKVDAITRPSPPFEDPSFGMGKEGYPVVNISPYAALTFCKWLSTITGKLYRLPTEAEWEYMCKAGDSNSVGVFADQTSQTSQTSQISQTSQTSRIDQITDYAWSYENSNDKYAKVGQKLPNAFSLFDILGNVAEWTLDQYDEDFYNNKKDTIAVNPWNIPTQLHPRVFRGGSWDDDAKDLTCTLRSKSGFYLQKNDPQIPKSFWWYTDAPFIGFRLVSPVIQPDEKEVKKFWQLVLDE
ncbi:MAG: formylglycine-generating enzyme family protein [Cyclobacteriaceae bacterium]|nr:formylglycine-generating enzyme family protein [Cyclobacteriaceae bacterium]